MKQKSYLTITLLFIGALLLIQQSFATVALELTQGMRGALPIAVVPFTMPPGIPEYQDVSKVIAADLQHSGYFSVPNAEQYPQLPNSLQQVNFQEWRRLKIDNLVVGQVKQTGGRYQVKFQLIDAVGGKGILLTQEFSVPEKALRPLAHHISDLVYEALTGDKGIFSTKIAYIVVKREGRKPRYTLEVADFDGFNPQPLLVSSEPIMSPAWSPRADRLAYVSFEHKKAEIYVVNVATGQRQLITGFPGINGAPAWSPDGNKLALVLSKSGYPKIYVVDLAQRQLQQLTSDMSIDTEPRWSPDGRSIIFTSDRGGSPQIYQINLADKRVSRVTFNGSYNAHASYTKEGDRIVFQHQSGQHFTIAVQDVASGHLLTLTQHAQSESPALSPNNRMILYATSEGGRGVLGLVSIDGRVKLRLPARDGDVQEPAWSPYLG